MWHANAVRPIQGSKGPKGCKVGIELVVVSGECWESEVNQVS